MLTQIHPKLPMRNKQNTKDYYIKRLGFDEVNDYGDYLMLHKDNIEIHFFEFKDLNINSNYGMIYIRTSEIESFYSELKKMKVALTRATFRNGSKTACRFSTKLQRLLSGGRQ